MNSEFNKSVKTALLLVSLGLMTVFFAFFLFFGKGLQLLMPVILFSVFFIVFLLIEKLPFISTRLWLKIIIAVIFVAAAVFFM